MKLLYRVFNKLFSCYKIYTLNVNKCKNIVLNSNLNQEFKVINLTLKDLILIYTINKYRKDYSEVIINRLQDENYICFCLIHTHNQEIACMQWLKKTSILIKEMNFNLKMNDDEIFFHDDFTVPKYRKRGLHKFLFKERLKYCINNNFQKGFIHIICGNKIAIETVEKIGFVEFKRFFKLMFLR